MSNSEQAELVGYIAGEDKGGVLLSDEVDENGRQFVLNSKGEIAFGEIAEDTGLTPAPILLSEGLITNPATNDGYGLVHIEARHGDQIRNAGYNSVVEFVEEVAKNYEVIREGKDRDGHQTYMLQLTDKHNNTLMVELSGDGTYWNINTAGIFKTSYGKNRKEVYNRHTTAKQSTETVEASQDAEQSGTEATSSMNAPTTSSASEDRNSVSNSQENAQKSGEIAENGGEITETTANLTDSEPTEQPETDELSKAEAVQRVKRILTPGAEGRRLRILDRVKRWEKLLGVEIVVHESTRDITNDEALAAIAEAEKTGKAVPGWFDGKGHIYLPHNFGVADIDATALHEVVAHMGIKEMLSPEQWDEFRDKVWEAMSEDARERYLSYVGADLVNPSQENRRAAADEYVAALAERVDMGRALETEDRNVWQKFCDAVRKFFAKKGEELDAKGILSLDKLTDGDIANMVRVSFEGLKAKDGKVSQGERFNEEKEDIRFRKAFHGSGAQFDKFDHSFMGTGEGAQAFGWGTYVSEVEGIGKQYAKATGKPRLAYKGEMVDSEDFNNPWRIIKDLYNDHRGRLRDMRAAAERYSGLVEEDNAEMKELWANVLEKLNEVRAGDLKIVAGRNLYTVEIPDDNGSNYLHWDKRIPMNVVNSIKKRLFDVLAEGDYKGVEKELKRELDDVFKADNNEGYKLYGAISDYLGDSKEASQFLNDMGFVGISYPANATTGGRADGARNYVIFNENDAQIESRTMFRIAKVNEKFNEQLGNLTEENADAVELSLGTPSLILKAAGVKDMPMKLYGNKVIKKMKKHGFKLEELKDLPMAVADPIAVFNNRDADGNRAILTELKTADGNFLVTIDLGDGTDIDFNIVSSVFGKSDNKIVTWFNKGFATYINKEKALDYLHLSAPIAEASDKPELSSVANVINNFENPSIKSENSAGQEIRFRKANENQKIFVSNARKAVEEIKQEKATPEMQESVMQGQTMFRILTYPEAVQEAKSFEERHRGSAPVVVIDGIKNWESEFAKAGVKQDEIDIFRERLKKSSGNPKAAYLDDADLIFIFRPKIDEKDFNGYIWHENIHKAIREDDREGIRSLESVLREILGNDFDEAIKEAEEHGYMGEEAYEELACQLVQKAYLMDRMNSNGLKGRGVFQDFINPLIKKIYGRGIVHEGVLEENNRANEKELQGGSLAAPVDRGRETEVATKTQEATGGLTEGEINFLEAATGYSREEIIRLFGDNGTRFRMVGEQHNASEREIARNTATAVGEKLNTPVSVIEDSSALPENRRNKKGWFDPKTGEVAVVMGNHISTEDVVETVLHEVVGKKGLRAVFGDKFDELLDAAYSDPRIKQVAGRMFFESLKNGRAMTLRQCTEKLLADLARKGFKGYEVEWNAVRLQLRDLFSELTGIEVSDNELRYLLWKNSNKKNGFIETVENRAMEAKTKESAVRINIRTADSFRYKHYYLSLFFHAKEISSSAPVITVSLPTLPTIANAKYLYDWVGK